jgi:hypothetical protein
MVNIKLGENTYKNVHSISMETESGDSVIFPRYVISEPIEAMLYLDNWNGTTYNIKLENYKIGNYGIQVGMPLVSDVDIVQTILECAFTISYSSFTAATSSAAAYTTIRLSAIKTPLKDIPITLFGLEKVQ